MANYLEKTHLDSYIKEASAIYNAKNKKEAERAYGKWQLIAPKVVRCVEKNA